MIRITFAEGMTFAQPDGLPRREAELFWRGTRLIRRCTAKGGAPDALIADLAADQPPLPHSAPQCPAAQQQSAMVSKWPSSNKLAHTAAHSQLLSNLQTPELCAAHSEVVLY